MKIKPVLKYVGSSTLACLLSTAVIPSFETRAVNWVGGQANAQQQEPLVELAGCKEPPQKRRLKTLSQKFFKQVEKVDELTNPPEDKNGNAPEPNYRAAWPILQKMLERCDDCNAYEMAQLYQRAAFIQYNLDNVPGAIDYFKKVVQQSPNIPEGLETQLYYQIAQLLTSVEDYQGALEYFGRWESMCPSNVPDDYFYYRAQVYYQLGERDRALQEIERAIRLAEEDGGPAREQWYKLKLAILVDKEDYSNSERVAEKLVVHYTDPKMISQLASLYGMNGKEVRQLALMDALNVADELERESAYRNLAYLFLSAETPYLASRVLKKGIEENHVPRSAKNLETLAVSLTQAQESEEAIPVMEEAASKADHGKIYGTLAAIYLEGEEYDKAISSARRALNKGGLRSEAEMYLYIGSSYIYKEEFDDAITALRRAAKEERYEKYATDMIRYAKKERQRLDELNKSAASIEDDAAQTPSS